MNTQSEKAQESTSQSVSALDVQMESGDESSFQFVDNRPKAVTQLKLQEMASNSSDVQQIAQLQEMANNYSAQHLPIPKKENKKELPGHQSPIQREVVSTGGDHYDPVNELLTESGDVDADHVNDLLYGLAGARGKTQGRIRKEANDGDQANDKRTIDEYNRIIGLGGIIQPMYAGFMIYKVRQALEDPNNWKSIITGCKEDYSEAEGSNNVQKWMALLVKHKQNIGLYDLGNSTRPVIGRTLFGRDKLGEAAGVTKIKEKRRFEKNMGEEDSGKFSESDVHKMLSFGSDFDSAHAYYLSLEKNKQTPIGRWIQMAFWRRTSKLGIDFATSVEGLDANVHFNLSSSESYQDEMGNTKYGELRLWGILDDIAADKGTRKITESEWRHVKKLIQNDPSLADRIHGYSER